MHFDWVYYGVSHLYRSLPLFMEYCQATSKVLHLSQQCHLQKILIEIYAQRKVAGWCREGSKGGLGLTFGHLEVKCTSGEQSPSTSNDKHNIFILCLISCNIYLLDNLFILVIVFVYMFHWCLRTFWFHRNTRATTLSKVLQALPAGLYPESRDVVHTGKEKLIFVWRRPEGR